MAVPAHAGEAPAPQKRSAAVTKWFVWFPLESGRAAQLCRMNIVGWATCCPRVCGIENRRGRPGGRLLSLVRPRESNQRDGRPGSPVFRTSLCCSPCRAAAELALAVARQGLRQSSPTSPDTAALLGGSQGEAKPSRWSWHRMFMQRCALSAPANRQSLLQPHHQPSPARCRPAFRS